MARRLGVLALGAFAGLAGAAVLVRRAIGVDADPESPDLRVAAAFGGADLKNRSSAFRGGLVLAWFGGVRLDLREAELAADARLAVSTVCGGVQILVPSHWRIDARVRPLLGGVDVGGVEPEEPDAPLLVLEGTTTFGGLAVARKAPA